MFGGYWTNSRHLGWIVMILAVLLLAQPGFCGDSGVELLLEQSPANGGSLDLGTGVHQYTPGTEITITAVPQDGFRFSYWLGDVSDSTSSTTTIRLDDSRAVIAVYEPLVLGLGEEEILPQNSGGGGGGGSQLTPTAVDLFSTSFSIPSGGGQYGVGPSEIAVVTVPEPATLGLLGLGALALLKRRRRYHR